MTPIEPMTFDSEGPDPTGNLSPSTAELAQCEAEMGTLLRIIAELNKKMGSLKPPRLNQSQDFIGTLFVM